MKFFIVLALCVCSTLARPGSYGYADPQVRISSYEAPALVRSSYEAPVVRLEPYVAQEVKAVPIPIIKHLLKSDNAGTYSFEVETGNGIIKTESGSLKNLGNPEGPSSVKQGSYSWTDVDGKTYTTNWTADENGFHPTGDHLPTPPPVPEEILKGLAVPRIPEYQDDLSTPVARVNTYAAPAVRLVKANYY